MLIIHVSLAAIAVLALALAPRRSLSALVVALAAAADLALDGGGAGAMTVVGPLIGFLAAALTLSAIVAETGLVDRVAARLASAARGSSTALYLMLCGLCAALTAVVSLDGAVVLMVPLALALRRRCGMPLAPALLGIVAVANAGSIATPEGNPTNLVVISRLHLSAAAFTAHMILPGVIAAAVCTLVIWGACRRELDQRWRTAPLGAGASTEDAQASGPLTAEQRLAAVAFVAAALAAWAGLLAGIAPWWPFIGVVAIAVLVTRRGASVIVPWRIAVQIGGLAIAVEALGLAPPALGAASLPVLLAVALGTGALAALINNLPASVWASTLLGAGPVAYAATIGLAVGALAAPQGSVASLIAADLAGDQAPALNPRLLMGLGVAATVAATLLLGARL